MKDHIRYLNLSRQYIKAAVELSAQGGQGHRFPVPHYLAGHALELALKSHLVYRGADEKTLKNISHRLTTALERSDASVSQLLQHEQVVAIRWLDEYYARKELEYPAWGGAGGHVQVPDLTYFVDATKAVYRHLDRIYRAEVRAGRKP
jgi:hypothetical protein